MKSAVHLKLLFCFAFFFLFFFFWGGGNFFTECATFGLKI